MESCDQINDVHQTNGMANQNFSPTSHPSSRVFNFAVSGMNQDDEDHGSRKPKASRDPLSHRIIEKRRRDRMNTCLADLSQLLPTSFLKQGQGRIEKTEIIEMAIKHIKLLQARLHRSAATVSTKITIEEKLLEGYQGCCADTSQYMEQIGYKTSDTMFRNLCVNYDAHISKQKQKVLKMYELLDKSSGSEDSLNMASASVCNESGSGNDRHTQQCSEGSSEYNNQNAAEMKDRKNLMEIIQANDKQTECLPPNGHRQGGHKQDSAIGSSIMETSNGQVTSNTNSNSSDSESKVYKYKNKIQQRFSGDPITNEVKQEFSTSSAKISLLDDRDDFKGPLPTKPASSLTGTEFSSDFYSSRNGSTGGSTCESSVKSSSSNDSGSNRNGSHSDLNNTVPAFALHPMGVHYIPLVLPVSQVMPFMRNHKAMGICHPVSIPVSFSGPFLMGSPNLEPEGSLSENYHHKSAQGVSRNKLSPRSSDRDSFPSACKSQFS